MNLLGKKKLKSSLVDSNTRLQYYIQQEFYCMLHYRVAYNVAQFKKLVFVLCTAKS